MPTEPLSLELSDLVTARERIRGAITRTMQWPKIRVRRVSRAAVFEA